MILSSRTLTWKYLKPLPMNCLLATTCPLTAVLETWLLRFKHLSCSTVKSTPRAAPTLVSSMLSRVSNSSCTWDITISSAMLSKTDLAGKNSSSPKSSLMKLMKRFIIMKQMNHTWIVSFLQIFEWCRYSASRYHCYFFWSWFGCHLPVRFDQQDRCQRSWPGYPRRHQDWYLGGGHCRLSQRSHENYRQEWRRYYCICWSWRSLGKFSFF